MKTNRGTTVAIAVTLFAVLVTTLQLPAQELTQQGSKNNHQYQFIDLGTLGGPNSYLPLLSALQATLCGSRPFFTLAYLASDTMFLFKEERNSL